MIDQGVIFSRSHCLHDGVLAPVINVAYVAQNPARKVKCGLLPRSVPKCNWYWG